MERPPPREGRCQMYIPRKQRYCTVPVDPPLTLCHDHRSKGNVEAGKRPRDEEMGGSDERIACPFNNNHTIRKKDLTRHLGVCPHRTDAPSLHYAYKENCNIAHPEVEKIPFVQFNSVGPADQQEFLLWVEKTYNELCIDSFIDRVPESTRLAVPPALAAYVASGRVKEATQHVSLVNVFKEMTASQGDVGILEYGAGKAGFGVALRMADPTLASVFIDRDVFRDMKERAFRKEGERKNEKQHWLQERVKMDVKDFDLDIFLHHQESRSDAGIDSIPNLWTVVGKHLCGGCTDMTLTSVCRSHASIGGVLIATCCHQLCSADTYVWPALFPPNKGIYLSYCRSIAGWAISGEGIDDRRRTLGWKAKRLLDFGRLRFLQSARRGDRPLFAKVRLIEYVATETTIENIALLAEQ